MPCRCDGYEVTAADVRAEMSKKLEHAEQQLCNARSLIHKILQCRPLQGPRVRDFIPVDLLRRAEAHVDLLAKHKREEHESDVADARSAFVELERQAEYAARAATSAQGDAERLRIALAEARAKLEVMAAKKDEDLLG